MSHEVESVELEDWTAEQDGNARDDRCVRAVVLSILVPVIVALVAGGWFALTGGRVSY
ncbi:hypothetical protein P9139_05315 [Curtobacterium flaccumfaciens]|nr:hypothetical protein P9139_05315 [Curtobacterium flaccumfaciens]